MLITSVASIVQTTQPIIRTLAHAAALYHICQQLHDQDIQKQLRLELQHQVTHLKRVVI